MAQQTAVEWLLTQLENYSVARHPEAFNPIYIIEINVKEMHDFIKQAKAMEKDQIMNAFSDGKPLEFSQSENARQYYNETYNHDTQTN